MSLRTAALMLVALVVVAGCGGPVRDRDALVNALANASSGDTIEVGEGEYTGTFRVPAGVALVAVEGEAAPVFVATSGIALRVSPGEAEPTTLSHLVVRAAGVGIAATGAGAVVLDDVSVTSETGIAVVAEGLDALTLADVELEGPLTAENVDALGGAVDASTQAIAGLVLSEVAGAELRCVAVRGFAGFGVALLRSQGAWIGGCVEGNAGTGILLEGATFELRDGTCGACDDDATLRIGDGLKSNDVASDFIAPFGLVATSGSAVTSSRVSVEDIPGLGVVHVDSDGDHRGIRLQRNDGAGLWAQGARSHVRLGEGAEVNENRGGGVVVVDASDIELDDVTVASTIAVNRPLGEDGSITIGDGLHVKGATGVIALNDVAFAMNERASVLLDQGDAAELPTVTMTAVSIVVEDDAYGCLAQDGMSLEDTWDITMDEAVAARDATAPTLDTAGRVASVPTMGAAAEVGVVAGGLLGDDGLCDSHVEVDGSLVTSDTCGSP